MNTNTLNTMTDTMMTITQTFSSIQCNEYDVFNEFDEKVAQYSQYFVNKHTLENLENAVYEIYYDYNETDGDYTSSFITEDYNDVQEIIDDLAYFD
jgi:hypothetical protein